MKPAWIFAGVLLAAPAQAQDAPMFRGNLARTGVTTGQPLTGPAVVKWTFHTDGRVISSPAVVGGTVYFGSTDGNVYAVDTGTGTRRWAFKTGSRVTSSPAVSGGLVYVGSYDGNFYAIDAGTGALRWKFATGGERRFAGRHLHGRLPAGEVIPDPFDIYLSSPAVSRGMVYFGSGDSHVYALDAATGRIRWTFKTGNVVHASPTIAGELLYIGSWDTWFYALNALTGRMVWRFKTGEDAEYNNQTGIQATAAVADGTVYFECRDAHVYALDARTGRKKWAFDTHGSWGMSSPAVRDGKVWFATADGRSVHEVDAASGKDLFALQFSWYFSASPAIVGNFAYAGNWDGRLIAIDLDARKVAWIFQTDSSRANRGKYIKPDSSMNYRAAMLEPFADDFGVEFVNIFSMGSFLSSPAVVDGVLYIGSTDGNLYALAGAKP